MNNRPLKSPFTCESCGALLFLEDVVEAAAWFECEETTVRCGVCGYRHLFKIDLNISKNRVVIEMKYIKREKENPEDENEFKGEEQANDE